MSVIDGDGGLLDLRMSKGDIALITPGLHCRYDWVLVWWGGGRGTCADPESFVIVGQT